jgi:hypothetical protein
VWICALLAGPAEFVRVAAQLSLVTVGILIAFVHTSPVMLKHLRRFSGVSRPAEHLSSTGGRATVDASGLIEGVGAWFACWLFVGPLPLAAARRGTDHRRSPRGRLRMGVRGSSMIAPGWYSVTHPPSQAMRSFRLTIPPILAALIFVNLFPYGEAASQMPNLVLYSLIATPLLYYAIWAAFDVMLRASVRHVESEQMLWRQDTSSSLHSLVKNSVGLLQRYVDEPQPDLFEIRGMAQEIMITVDLDDSGDGQSS